MFYARVANALAAWDHLLPGNWQKEARRSWPRNISRQTLSSNQSLMFCSSRKAYKLLTCTKPAQQITRIRAERACLDSQCLDLCILDFTTGNCYRYVENSNTEQKKKMCIKHTINFSFSAKTVLPAFLIVQVRVIRGKNGLNAIILMIKTYITLFRGSYLLVILNIVTETFILFKKMNS